MEPSAAPIEREPITSARDETKLTSAVSKDSKDSGYDHENSSQTESEQSNKNEDGTVSPNVITEQSPTEEVNQVINENRPNTPDFVMTGRRVSEVPGSFALFGLLNHIFPFHNLVRQNQSQSVLEELSAQNVIKEPQISKSGQMAFVIGESDSGKKRPPRLPPIKPSTISQDQINNEQAKASIRKQV